MKTFKYKEIQPNGKHVEGEIEAENKEEVIKTIQSRGGTVLKIEMTKGDSLLQRDFKISIGGKVKLKDLAIFSKQMSTLLNTGVTLVRALDTVSEQTTNKKLKEVTREMSLEIQKGNTLQEIMRAHPKIFPQLMVSMVGAAEMTGQIDDTFEKLNVHYTKENKTRKIIVNAMIYPIFLFITMIIVVGVMLVWVMPSILSSYDADQVPWITKMVMNLSNNIKNYWYIHASIILLFILVIKRALKTDRGKYYYDLFTAKIPVVGKTLNIIITSRFARTMSTLMSSGNGLIPSLTMSAELTNNKILMNKMDIAIDEIKKGRTLGVLLREMDFFPTIMVSMVSIGEESGDLDGMLAKTSEYYEDEYESAIKVMLNILEPAIIIIMALLIVTMMIAFMLPMFGMYDTIG